MAATDEPTEAPADERDKHGETSAKASRRRTADEHRADERPGDVENAARSKDAAPLHASLIALNRRQPPAPPAPPAPDALEPDRILELPARRVPAARRDEVGESEHAPDYIRPTPLSAGLRGERRLRAVPAAPAERGMGKMSSLREAAQPYLAHLAVKRRATSSDAAGESERDDTHGAPTAARTTRPLEPVEADVCSLCHGAGFVRLDVPVGDKLFGQAVRCECKEREIEERERQKLRDFSSLKPFEKKTFATFETNIQGVAEAFEVARRYADDPNGWLVLQGGYGCGKTHLAAAIAHVREEAGETVFFSIVPDLLDHLRATFAPNSEITYDDLFDRVRHVGLLVLDDLGSENSTAWATEKLFQIINYRYNYRLPTVITTNIRLLSHLDDRIRSRLGDIGLVRWVVMNAPDYRERHTGHAGGSDGGRPPRTTRGRSYGR